MTTLERPHEAIHRPTAPLPGSSRRSLAVVLVAVLALVVGGVAGYVLRGDDAAETAAIVLAGEGEPTARQEQMLDRVRDAERAWGDGNVDAVLALFAPNGRFEAFDTVYRVDDGTLADYIARGDWSSLEVLEPVLVHGNEVFTFHRFGGGTLSETFTFTSTGELLIISHVIHT